MADIPAKLNNSGQLVSTIPTGTTPLIVVSTTKVPNLNAAMVDGLDSTSFLRSNANSTLTSPKTLSVDGEIKINPTGKLVLDKGAKLTLGWFEINTSGSLISINYNPS